MVTYCATNLTATCSPMIGQFLDTMILASINIIYWLMPIIDYSAYNDPSKSTSWKVLETVSSHLKTKRAAKINNLKWIFLALYSLLYISVCFCRVKPIVKSDWNNA